MNRRAFFGIGLFPFAAHAKQETQPLKLEIDTSEAFKQNREMIEALVKFSEGIRDNLDRMSSSLKAQNSEKRES